MDADAVSAALTPSALAPAIAKSLGLPAPAVENALLLLAGGAQPAFLARYRRERIGDLTISDLEKIQARAAAAVAFEFRRAQAVAELDKKKDADVLRSHIRRAQQEVELEDLKSLAKRRRRGPGAKARAAGLTAAALAMWQHGSKGAFSDPQRHPDRHAPRGKDVSAEADGDAEAAEDAGATDVAAPPDADAMEGDASVHAAIEDRASPDHTDRDTEEAAAAAPADDAPSAEAAPAPPAEEAAPEEAAPEEAAPEEAAPDAGEHADVPEAAPAEDTAPTEAAPEDAKPQPPPEPFDPDEIAAQVNAESVPDHATALAGIRAICAEHMTEHPPLRQRLRKLLLHKGKLCSTVVEAKKEKAARFQKYFDRAEACSSLAPFTVLALHRAEREGFLTIDFDIDTQLVKEAIITELKLEPETPAGAILLQAAREAWEHGLGRAVRTGARKLIKDKADRAAIADFCEALRPLLLAPAFGRHPVMAIDPGQQNGCRLAVVGVDGELLADDTVYPLQPKLQVPQAKARIAELCREYGVMAIAVESGAAGREVERMCRELVRDTEGLGEVKVASVDPDAAALHASSRGAKEELKEKDAALRRALSAGRRLQDPLRELSKIDPRKLGLGQHQHEVDQEELRGALEQGVGSCVSQVGVDLAVVSAEQLARIPGMSHALAKAVVAARSGEPGLRSRSDLLHIPGLAGKGFEQASGFLRIRDGDNVLDRTMIHPERYGQITEMARDLGVTVSDLLGNAELVDKIEFEKYDGRPGVSGEPLGRPTFEFIVDSLVHPDHDPRPAFVTASFHPDLKEFGDLQVGMELEGIVTHLAGFGAFVDVGIAQEGLVHVSELSHGFVTNPLDAVHVGQRVRGRVIEISPDRKRFSLSIKALLPQPDRPARRPDARPGKGGGGPREGRGGGGPREGKGGKGKGTGKGKGARDNRREDKGKPRDKDRVLGFRMDLTDLADRLNKG